MIFFSGFILDSASSLKQHPQEHILLYKNTFFILQANHSLFLLLITDNKYCFIVVGFTWPGIKFKIYHTWGKYAYMVLYSGLSKLDNFMVGSGTIGVFAVMS